MAILRREESFVVPPSGGSALRCRLKAELRTAPPKGGATNGRCLTCDGEEDENGGICFFLPPLGSNIGVMERFYNSRR